MRRGYDAGVPGVARSRIDKDAPANMSSMVKQLLAASLLALSVAAAAQSYQTVPAPAGAPYGGAISATLADWSRLRQSDAYAFGDYARFLTRHPGFPGEDAMRKTAERVIPAAGAYPADVVGFFAARKPLTGTGWARYAEALAASGRTAEAAVAARSAWGSSGLSPTDETRLQARFAGSLTTADHDARVERLLADRQTGQATRMLAWASPARQPIYGARIALQMKQADAESRVLALGPRANADAGLLMDRSRWLRDNGRGVDARNLLAQFRLLETRPYDAEKWFENQLLFARGAANDRNWSTAYRIASQLDDAYPAGVDVSAKSLGERDEYTSLAWLAGTAALHHLNRPADAVGMFDRYARAAKSPQTRSKGMYWAGRAAQAAGDAARGEAFLAQAGAYPDQYYGQLALERLGRPLTAPAPVDTASLSEMERQAFANRELVQAIRALGAQGRTRDQALFLRALAADVDTDAERALASQLAGQIVRPDLGVMVGRQARMDGGSVYTRAGFPAVRVPSMAQSQWTMVHAIARQESQFDREAVSHAGARGTMQLMPGTAREVAGKLGLPYDVARLTRDTDYNIMLGSSYFAQMLSYWGGNYPLAVASYNAGPGNVRSWIRRSGDPRLPGADIVRWVEDIPIFETRNYVQRVLENAVVYDMINPARTGVARPNRLSWYLNKNRPG